MRRPMQEMYVAERTADSVTIAFKNPNMTMIPPIMKKLEEDDNVVLVRYIDTHPDLDDRRIQVKVRDGDPMDAVAKACDGLVEEFSGLSC